MFSPILAMARAMVCRSSPLVADRLLIEQARPARSTFELAFDDLLDHLRGFFWPRHLRPIDRLLALEHVGGTSSRRTYSARRRRCAWRSFTSVWKLVGARHEVGLAVHLDEHADLAAHVDVAGRSSPSLVVRPAFLRLRESAFAQDRRRLSMSPFASVRPPCTPSSRRRSGRAVSSPALPCCNGRLPSFFRVSRGRLGPLSRTVRNNAGH